MPIWSILSVKCSLDYSGTMSTIGSEGPTMCLLHRCKMQLSVKHIFGFCSYLFIRFCIFFISNSSNKHSDFTIHLDKSNLHFRICQKDLSLYRNVHKLA